MKLLIKIYNWVIKMAKKILNFDTDTRVLSFEDGESLPSGTENQTLRHNGTEWVANDMLLVSEGYAQLNNVSTGNWLGYTAFTIKHDNYSNAHLGLYQYTNGYTSFGISGRSGFAFSLSIANQAPIFDVRKVTINGDSFIKLNSTKVSADSLVGTGSALLEATPDGTMQRSATVLPTRTEYLSGLLTGTEHTFTGTTLGITGDLRSRIKNIKCFAVDSNGDFNGDLIDNEFIYETDLVVNSATNLSGSFKIILFIEYV